LGILDAFKSKKSLEELEEENDMWAKQDEIWEHKLSVREKQQLIKELKNRGQNPDHFKNGGKFSFSKIKRWLTEH
jgi:superfamily I DNA/RNA helicase